jgi:beta-glucanase (GH16 family)
LNWEAAYAKSFAIQISANASTWTNLYSTTAGAGGIVTLGVSGSGRYVRMYGTVRSTAYGYSLWEFQVIGTITGATPTPTTAGATATPTTGTATATPTSGTGTYLWNDEFDGTAVNTGIWGFETGTGWGNGQLEWDSAGSNASVSGGQLLIQARKESSNGCAYTSTRMNTYGKKTGTYGKIEARIKLPMGQGLWPAFWMLGNSINGGTPWPDCGEIDIMEHINNVGNTAGTMHWNSGGGHAQYGLTYTCDPSQWHTYSVVWNSTDLDWYVDGVWYCNGDQTINNTGCFVGKPFFVILNLAVGGAWPGSPDASTVFPANMYVDYVRWYK